jgi:hypothetical protein
MIFRRLFLLFWLLAGFAGCGSPAAPDSSQTDSREKPRLPQAERELQQFLAIVKQLTPARLPEFQSNDGDDPSIFQRSSKEIIQAFETKLTDVMDPEQQGAVWESNPDFATIFQANEISGTWFADWNRRVTLAILRIRFDSRGDLDQLIANSRKELKRLQKQIDKIDEVPPRSQTRDARLIRAQTSFELAKAAALTKYALLLRKVSEEEIALVRRYSKQLKPLIPAGTQQDLLEEFCRIANPTTESAEVQTVGFESDTPAPASKAKRRARD